MELSNKEMESSKQEMELFLPLPGFWWKNFFYNIFFICSKVFKIDFQNRKRNYPNRKWNYFSHLIKKKFFTKCCSFVPRGSKSTIMQQKLWSHWRVTMRLRIKYLFTKCLPLMDLNEGLTPNLNTRPCFQKALKLIIL